MICDYIINKEKHQIDYKVRRHNHYFSTRLPYADKRIRKILMNMINTTYNSTEDIFKKLQSVNRKTRLNFYKIISNYYDEMKHKIFKFEEDPFSKNAQGICKVYHEMFLLMRILQIKPQAKNMFIKYYDLYYTLIKNRDEKEIVDDKYENNEIYYIKYEDFISPNHYIRKKKRQWNIKVEKFEISYKSFRIFYPI